MSLDEQPLSVYRCMRATSCPQGPIGEDGCQGQRGGIACTECRPSKKLGEQGCTSCSGFDEYKIMLWWALLLLILPVPLYYKANGHCPARPTASIVMSCAISLLLTNMQIMGAYNMMSVGWPGVFSDCVSSMGVFMFDLTEVLALDCVFTMDSVKKYLTSASSFVGVVLSLALFFLLSRAFPKHKKFPAPWEFSMTINAAGACFQMGFITMASIAMTPLMCYTHPNGLSSVILYPNVFCWESAGHTHMLMLALMVAGVMCAFIVVVVHAALRAPSMSQQRGMSYLNAIRFLTFKYRLDRWYFSLAPLLRGLVLSLVTVLSPNDAAVQVIFSAFVICTYMVVLIHQQPYKIPLANALDALSCFALLFMLILSTAFMSPPEVSAEDGFGSLSVALLVASNAALALTLLAAWLVALRGGGRASKLPGAFLLRRPLFAPPAAHGEARALWEAAAWIASLPPRGWSRPCCSGWPRTSPWRSGSPARSAATG